LASDDVDPAATQVDVLVSRIECSGGVTGEVLEPGVVTTETEVVVTFTVAPRPPGAYSCPGNDEVPATVDLGAPIGTRALVDGSCTAPEGPEGPLGDCALDGIRWHLPGTTPATDEPHACDAAHDPDGRTDVATEPDGRSADDADWTDRDGCIVRIDVVAERPGPANCGWEATRVLTTARVPGVRPDDGDETVDFVRDPDGAYGDPELVSGLDLDADVPDDAVDTGLRLGDVELWAVLDDPSAVWLASPDGVERWPAGEVPLCR
jgi:hypothetical protein